MRFDWIFSAGAMRGVSGKPYFMRVSRTMHPVPALFSSMRISTIRAKPLMRFRDFHPRGIAKRKTPCSCPC